VAGWARSPPAGTVSDPAAADRAARRATPYGVSSASRPGRGLEGAPIWIGCPPSGTMDRLLDAR